MLDENRYIDIVIRNTEILSEFTSLTKRIETLVGNLPDNKDYEIFCGDLATIKEEINQLVIFYKTSVNLNDKYIDRLDHIPNIARNIEGIISNINEIPEINGSVKNIKIDIDKLDNLIKDIQDIKTDIANLKEWQKVKLPFIVGFLTTIIYAIGLYFQFK